MCYNKIMIEKLKQLFKKDRTVELQLIDIIKQQQEFISKNITERVVYVDPQSGYTNADRFEDPNSKKEDDEDEFEMPEEMTPERLQEMMEGSQEDNSEEGKK